MPKDKATNSTKRKRPDPPGLPEASAANECHGHVRPQDVAQRLHDTVCQTLSGARMLASVVRRKLPAGSEEALVALQSLDEELLRASKEVHTLMGELRAK